MMLAHQGGDVRNGSICFANNHTDVAAFTNWHDDSPNQLVGGGLKRIDSA
jgi:hypothetical protein